jgi:hypothetical protein
MNQILFSIKETKNKKLCNFSEMDIKILLWSCYKQSWEMFLIKWTLFMPPTFVYAGKRNKNKSTKSISTGLLI